MLIFRSIGNILQLSQNLQSSRQKFEFEHRLNLQQSVRVNRIVIKVKNQIALRQNINLGKNISYNLSNNLQLSDDVSIGPSEHVVSYLQLASRVTIVTPVYNVLELTQTLSYNRPNKLISSLNLQNTIDYNIIKVRQINSNLVLNNNVKYIKYRNGQVNLCESQIPFDLEETDN